MTDTFYVSVHLSESVFMPVQVYMCMPQSMRQHKAVFNSVNMSERRIPLVQPFTHQVYGP